VSGQPTLYAVPLLMFSPAIYVIKLAPKLSQLRTEVPAYLAANCSALDYDSIALTD